MYIPSKMETPKIFKNNRDIRKVSNKQHQYEFGIHGEIQKNRAKNTLAFKGG